MAQAAPLMPKATAVWLLDNTSLSFDQVADFCKLHPLEVKAIADGDAAMHAALLSNPNDADLIVMYADIQVRRHTSPH